MGVMAAAVALPAFGQYRPSSDGGAQTGATPPAATVSVPETPVQAAAASTAALGGAVDPAVQTLLSFRPSDAKFDVEDLMDILRDKRHEGWVLAAYPDPKTAQPLIGAGFSLDLPAREHPQRDLLNPNQFLEPSSADLWQAAGLPPEKLQAILADFNQRLVTLDKTEFRRQIWSLEPQITSNDANALLRIGVIQAIDNAKAYCRNFDRLSASQQMAMTQLVYQMGINLQEFSTFLGLMNRDNVAESAAMARTDRAYWREVQLSLVQSQWARLYRERAKAVIAMLDPSYEANPTRAERRINAVLPSRHRRHRTAHLREASYTRRRGAAARRRARTRKN
jgi:GH24 family phage-related lysozyme (muramidase)